VGLAGISDRGRQQGVTEDLQEDGSAAEGGIDEPAAGEAWSAAERALLNAAMDFYGAAGGVIDLAGPERPQLRRDADGFAAVRKAMAAVEARVREAHAAGVRPERIAEIARIEPDMVGLILRRAGAAAPDPAES
jgi:hypothetical protein